MFEIYRRGELVLFLAQQFQRKGMKMFQIVQTSSLKLTRGQEKAREIVFDPSKKGQAGKQSQKLMKTLGNSNFLNALKIGYLLKRSEAFISWGDPWTEKFCVLTNVGLLYYNNPNERPRNLFPIIDSTIKPVPKSKYGKDYMFAIVSFSLEIEFAALSKEDYDSWMRAFKKLQEEFDKKRERQLASFS